MFDVRFVQDSILERIGKACQFGVMIGLAIVGTDFDPSKQEQDVFRTLALILMASRIVLGFQYIAVLGEVWHYRNTKMPLTLLVTANFVAAFIYMGTFFGFKLDNPRGQVFVVWYVTAVLETIVNIAVSSKWEVLTFAGTHLIKRMSLLTLIILGEGLIVLSKSIAKITEQEDSLTAPLIGTIISAVVIIYFIYMIYFDWLNRSHFGSFREGLWTFLHFPFHLALVLLVEGAAQFILWRKIVEVVASVNKLFLAAEESFTSASSAELSVLFSNVTNVVFERFNPEFTRTIEDAQKAIYGIGNTTFNSTEQLRQVTTLFAVIQDSLFDSFGIEAPKSAMQMTGAIDPNDEWRKNMDAFVLIFVYLFVSAGVTLILMNALNFISRPRKTAGDYMRIGVDFVVGISLCSIASIVHTEGGFEFAQSAWILPTVALCFVFVMSLGYTKLFR